MKVVVRVKLPPPRTSPTAALGAVRVIVALSLLGPPGPPGSSAPITRPITGQSSIFITHSFAATPRVTVLTAAGAEVDPDVEHTPGSVHITFAVPFTGTATLSD